MGSHSVLSRLLTGAKFVGIDMVYEPHLMDEEGGMKALYLTLSYSRLGGA